MFFCRTCYNDLILNERRFFIMGDKVDKNKKDKKNKKEKKEKKDKK